MWNEDNTKWLLLKNLLMVGARGSRIVVTTHSEMVASITGATSWCSQRGLPVEKAWNLFVKVAFGEGQLPKNQAFISLGKEILEKCVGVPLAIRTIASLLRSWRSFQNYELSKITQEEENYILSTLKLSFDHLPSYLKQCFAYCRLFPKDYKIHVGVEVGHVWLELPSPIHYSKPNTSSIRKPNSTRIIIPSTSRPTYIYIYIYIHIY